MKTTKKALLLALCAVLLIVSTVFATMAYLTYTTQAVKNTFTFGNVKITLDEAKVNEYGVKDGDTRVTANTYKLMPGHTYVKDPTIHVDANSEACWLFVKLENGLKDIIASENIEKQMQDYGWTPIDSTNNIWAYNKVVAAGKHINVFDEFTLTDNAVVSNYGDATIIVTAYAVQADGFNTAADAWNAAPSDWTLDATN